MARKVFYSFNYKRDSQRAAQVRNSHALADEDEYGVIDSVEWEKVERGGKEAIKKWINEQLQYTSVTAALIGAETADREWINYEIRESWKRGNGLVGVLIHNVKNLDGKTDVPGSNPFDSIHLKDGTSLSSIYKIYDWVSGDGITSLGKWVEEAFKTRETYAGEKELKDESSNDNGGSVLVRPQPQTPSTGPVVVNRPPAQHWSNA